MRKPDFYFDIENPLIHTDGYKVGMWAQFPEDMTGASYYISSRGGEFDRIMFAGINRVVKRLSRGITKKDVDDAAEFYESYFAQPCFHKDGWMRIVDECQGLVPFNIYAVPEGTVVPVNVPVAVFEITTVAPWAISFFETTLLRDIWYPSTVATISLECKRVINAFMEKTSDLTGDARKQAVAYKFVDFGARGASSAETAMIGGLANAYNFISSDTVESHVGANLIFDVPKSESITTTINAREHSTTVCYGDNGKLTPEQEDEAFMNSIKLWGDSVYACVMDSIDFEASIERLGNSYLRNAIIERGGVFIARPDSGNMYDNIMFALESLGKSFGYTYNEKGYKVLNEHVRIIQGDGLDDAGVIWGVLSWMESKGWSTDNIAFGMGGGLLQKCDRDTNKWAMKMSAIKRGSEWKAVRKNPKGEAWKASIAGRLRTMYHPEKDEYAVANILVPFQYETFCKLGYVDAMETYMLAGVPVYRDTFQQVRQRSDDYVETHGLVFTL